ncbi:MAG: NAD+ synthase [Gammaproteobacteria bacterium]|nr:NAD+ synthase [Gammaproteobacteria bacterium]
MTTKLRIVLAQLNFKVGDIAYNLKKHLDAAITARDELNADVIVFPELSLTAYPPEDLLLRKAFIEDAQQALQKLVAEVSGIYCVVGHPLTDTHHLFNACSLIYNGDFLGHYAKQRLPNYGVFDEARYFTPGNASCVLPIHNIPVGFVICEDLWKLGPTHQAAINGAQCILSPNASPFEIDKHEQRMAVLSKRALHDHLPIFYVNHIGGQDEIIFDGGSMVIDEKGNLSHCAGFFQEHLYPVDLNTASSPSLLPQTFAVPSTEERIYQTLLLSIKDYVEKNGFPGVLVGASGGIDSALTLALAVDALGKDRVQAVTLPSRYTSKISEEEANTLIQTLGIQSQNISIEPTYQSLLESLAPHFAGKKTDVTEENMQARCRAIILMALSNKSGYLVLTTGNRSELAVGYCTMYGDMAGGFAVLKDIPKTMVYQLARYRNRLHPVIPERTLERPPTAELALNQKDEDSLPPYAVLDKILDLYLNQTKSMADIIQQGFEEEIVAKVVQLIYRSEYKRHQAALGPHIHHKSFGKDWRYPITNGFKR